MSSFGRRIAYGTVQSLTVRYNLTTPLKENKTRASGTVSHISTRMVW
jgi:hypothetical protein